MDGLLEKGFAIRMYIGIIGDIHQPMRTITRVTRKHRDGDHGGELFPIVYNNRARNLKSLWDIGMDKLPQYKRVYPNIFQPLNDELENIIEKEAKLIMAEYPRNKIKNVGITNHKIMVNETHTFAKGFVYNKINENSRPSREYLNAGWEQCKRLIATAGYRTTNVLRDILKRIP